MKIDIDSDIENIVQKEISTSSSNNTTTSSIFIHNRVSMIQFDIEDINSEINKNNDDI